LIPGGKVNPFASYTWTVKRPGFNVESEVGFVFEVEAMGVAGFSVA
jgi:hypothetical protein